MGLGRERLRGADLHIPFPAVRLHRSVQPGLLERCAALALRLPVHAGFSHITAARLWGIPLAEPWSATELLHVTSIRPGARVRVAGVCGHTAAAGSRFVNRSGLPVTDALSTLLSLASLGVEELVVAGDHLALTPRHPRSRVSADPRPHLPLEALQAGVASAGGRDIRAVREAAGLVRDGAESRQETRLRLAMLRRGLPEPQLNVDVFDRHGGFIGRADMIYPHHRVIVEYDGGQHYSNERQHDRDMVRREEFAAAGYRYVSVRKYGMGRSPGANAGTARVEAALRDSGWRP